MTIRLVSILVLALAALPPLAAAQERPGAEPPTSPSNLQLEVTRKRFVVLPRPPEETVAQDAETARQELLAEERRDALIRSSRERPLSRPELDYSVTSGIQSQRVLRALRR